MPGRPAVRHRPWRSLAEALQRRERHADALDLAARRGDLDEPARGVAAARPAAGPGQADEATLAVAPSPLVMRTVPGGRAAAAQQGLWVTADDEASAPTVDACRATLRGDEEVPDVARDGDSPIAGHGQQSERRRAVERGLLPRLR